MKGSLHPFYFIGSVVAALISVAGVTFDSPVLYAIVPGAIGGILTLVASWRFLRHKRDLAGFIATSVGFIYYQAFQANPLLLPEFSGYLLDIPKQDQLVGIFLGNLTTAMLLLGYHGVSKLMGSTINRMVPNASQVPHETSDGTIMVGFWILFAFVALPNVLFGKVVVGAIDNILYQRLTWVEGANYSGFETWGGPLGASLANLGLWASSLFILWLYLLRSSYRVLMIVLSPLIILWTASVVLQGSRTYLVTVGFAMVVFLLGDPKFGVKALWHALWAIPLLFLMVQLSTLFRGGGLQSVNIEELNSRLFEIRGNEGTSNQIDGIEYFRTECIDRGLAPNPVLGFFRGIIERPYEGLVMPIPRSLFPWKPFDERGLDFNLFYQNVRLGVPSEEAFLGASPGLIGRELIKYGIFGPITLLFWMGLVLVLADRLYDAGTSSDFHRIYAALLIAFFVAQARDFVPLWFLPFLPAGLIFAYVVRRAQGRLGYCTLSPHSPQHSG